MDFAKNKVVSLFLIACAAILVAYTIQQAVLAYYPEPAPMSNFDGSNENIELQGDTDAHVVMGERAGPLDGPIEGGEPMSSMGASVNGLRGTEIEPSAFPSSQLNSEELLPNDRSTSVWAEANPGISDPLKERDFLSSGFHQGINTQGSSNRNANWQLRSEPPNPMVPISPWNQTTITYDNSRRPLEIGGDY